MKARAQRKGFDEVFAKLDRNQNGRIFIRDYIEEMRLLGLEVDEKEIKTLESFASGDGMVGNVIPGMLSKLCVALSY